MRLTEHLIYHWRGIARPPLSHITFPSASLVTPPRCLAAIQASFIFNPTGTKGPDAAREAGRHRERYMVRQQKGRGGVRARENDKIQ